VFVNGYKELLSEAISQLPEDWAGLHLAGQDFAGGTEHYSSSLNRLYKGLGAYAYVVNSKWIPFILERIQKEETQIDWYYARMMPELKWFKTKRCLVHHLAGYSDIMERYVDYSFLNK
jgi:hypothetical protein